MDAVKALKEEGNTSYAHGCKAKDQSSLKSACGKYAEAIELILPLEEESSALEDELRTTKIALFSNLAAANLKLENYKGLRC